MKFHFKGNASLLASIRADLKRHHAFAWERVGFLQVGLARTASGALILASEYRPVADDDYTYAPHVGAMINADAIRKAMDWAHESQGGIFHVHAHEGRGSVHFSATDNKANARLVPTFFNLAPRACHGAIVLSDDQMYGEVWTGRDDAPLAISKFSILGPPLRWWFA